MIDWKKLAEPFPIEVPARGILGVGFKPNSLSGDRAMAIPFIDARCVMQRLDDVVGPANWKFELLPLGNEQFLGTLSIRVDGEWVGKQDVGGPSEQPDGGDRMKSAASDALKRAAVHFSVGRYLYALPPIWAAFNKDKKKFAETPQLPAWAMPGGSGRPPATSTAATPMTAPVQPPKPQSQPQNDPTDFPHGHNVDQKAEPAENPEALAKDFMARLDKAESRAEVDRITGLMVVKKPVLGEEWVEKLRSKRAEALSRFEPPKVNVAKTAKEVLGAVPVSQGGPPFGVQ